MRKLLAVLCVCCFGAMFGGCSQNDAALLLGPKTLPLWIGARQYYGVEKDYAVSLDEGEKLAIDAIKSTGGEYRYTTSVGNSKTIYGRTGAGESIVVDVDPYRGYTNRSEIDISVGFVGNPAEVKKLFAAIAAEPLTKEVTAELNKDDSCDCK